MTELEAGVGDRGVIDDRHEAGRVAHQRLVEQGFVAIAKTDEIDVALEIARLLVEMAHNALDLTL